MLDAKKRHEEELAIKNKHKERLKQEEEERRHAINKDRNDRKDNIIIRDV